MSASVGIGLFSRGARSTFDLVETRINIIDQARTSFILAGESLTLAERRSVAFANSLRFDTLSSIREVSGETRFLFQQVLTAPERTAVEELALQLDRAGVSSRGLALEFATLLQASTPTEQQFNDIALQLGILPERLRELGENGIGPLITYFQAVNATQSDYQQALFALEDAHDDLRTVLGGFSQGVFETFIRGLGFIVDNLVTTEEETLELGDSLRATFGIDVDQTSPLGRSLLGYRSLIDGVADAAETAWNWTRQLLGLEGQGDRDDRLPEPSAQSEIERFRRQTNPLTQDEIYDPRFRLTERDLPLGTSQSSQTGIPTPVEITLDQETVGRFVVRTMDGVVRQVPRAL